MQVTNLKFSMVSVDFGVMIFSGYIVLCYQLLSNFIIAFCFDEIVSLCDCFINYMCVTLTPLREVHRVKKDPKTNRI